MENTETLTSLAMLKVDADEGRDYFEYLTPFVSYVLSEAHPNPVTYAGTQALLQNEFGLNIPKHAVGFVLGRLAKRRILKKHHGVFEIVGTFKDGRLNQKRAAARREQSVVVHNLIKYAFEEHKISWDDQSAGEAVVAYLTRFSVDCLRTFTQGCALPDLPSSSETQVFVVSKFVRHIHDFSAELFDAFVNLVKGHMLANALLCEDLESLQKKFRGVCFYLDTPFLLRLLGFWGKAQEEAAQELLDLLQRLEGRLALFEHTLNEVIGVIEFCEANLENPRASSHSMIAAMRHEGFSVSDLALVRNTLADFFAKHRMDVPPAAAYLPRYQIDETVLEATIENEIDYFNPRARENDVNSIRSIYTLRAGRRPLRLEDSVAVFVTTNTALSRAAFNFGKRNEFSSEVSAVITDFSLANIAWLKAPLGAPDLPRLELIADCYATMAPPAGLWSRYVEEIDKLKEAGNITPNEHELLKLSIKARDDLMNLTLGSEEAFSAGTVTTILSRVKADLTKEKDIQIEREREAPNRNR